MVVINRFLTGVLAFLSRHKCQKESTTLDREDTCERPDSVVCSQNLNLDHPLTHKLVELCKFDGKSPAEKKKRGISAQ